MRTYLQKTEATSLGGRAEIVEFSRAPGKFYLRIYIPASGDRPKRYKHKQMPGVSSMEEAQAAALDVFVSLNQIVQPSKVGATTGGAIGAASTQKKKDKGLPINDAFNLYLKEQQERIGNLTGVNITERVFNNRVYNIHQQLKPYCQQHGINRTTDIKLDSFDRYPLFRPNIKKHTLRTELGYIHTFLVWCKRKSLLTVDATLLFDELIKLPDLLGVDLQANPPFNEEDWIVFNRELRDWLKEMEGLMPGQNWHNPRVYHWRHMVWTLFMVLKTTGMRPVEAFRLTWQDIEFERVVRPSKSSQEKRITIVHLQIYDDKKTGMPREVTANCADRLIAWRDRVDAYTSERLGKKRKDTDLIFGCYHNDGKPYTYSNISRAWRDIRDRCEDRFIGPRNTKTNSYTIYSLRSSRVNELVNAGVDPLVIAKQLGHSAQTMLKFYQRGDIRDRAIREAVIGTIPFGQKKAERQRYTSETITKEISKR